MANIFSSRGTEPAQTCARPSGIGKKGSEKPVAKAGSTADDSNGGYAPTSLDEILTLKQCASWLKQPETAVLEMISTGQLKKLPFPGELRLHARTVLEQLGVSSGDSGGNDQSAAPFQAGGSGNNGVPQVYQSGEAEATSTKVHTQKPAPPVRPAKQPDQRSVVKPVVTKRSSIWSGRTVEVTYVTGGLQATMAEAAVLDVLVANLLKKDNSSN